MRAEQLLDVVGLLVGEEPTRTQGSSRPLVGEGIETAARISGPPVADRFAADAQEIREVGLRETQLTAVQGTQAEGFQNFIGQLTSVG